MVQNRVKFRFLKHDDYDDVCYLDDPPITCGENEDDVCDPTDPPITCGENEDDVCDPTATTTTPTTTCKLINSCLE